MCPLLFGSAEIARLDNGGQILPLRVTRRLHEAIVAAIVAATDRATDRRDDRLV